MLLSCAPPETAVAEALARVLASKPFRRARRRRRLLAYLVAETLAGRAGALKEYSIARDVYDLPEEFDPREDPRVRVEIRRLRATLARYYREEGGAEMLRFRIPGRTFRPEFVEALGG